MPKTWEQLTDQEKIEDLRRDMMRIFEAVRDLNHRLAFVGQNLGRVEMIALEAAKEVAELKAQLSSSDDGTGT